MVEESRRPLRRIPPQVDQGAAFLHGRLAFGLGSLIDAFTLAFSVASVSSVGGLSDDDARPTRASGGRRGLEG